MRPSLSLELIASLGLLLPGAQSVRFGSPAPAINFQTIDKQIPARKQSLDHLNSRYSPEALQVLRLSLNEPELLHQVQHEAKPLLSISKDSISSLRLTKPPKPIQNKLSPTDDGEDAQYGVEANVIHRSNSVLAADDGEFDLGPSFSAALTPAGVISIDYFGPEDDVPIECFDGAVNPGNEMIGCSPEKVSVINVTYADAPDPWTICKCDDTQAYNDMDLIQEIGKLPVGLRQLVRYFVGVNPTPGGYAGYTIENDIWISRFNTIVLWHEAGHVISHSQYTEGDLPDEASYVVALGSDQCYVTDYARDSLSEYPTERDEPWADGFAIVEYMNHVSPLLPGLDEEQMACARNQLQAIQNQVAATVDAPYDSSKRTPDSWYVPRELAVEYAIQPEPPMRKRSSAKKKWGLKRMGVHHSEPVAQHA